MAVASTAAGLQDGRGLSPRQSSCLPGGVSGARTDVPRTGPVRMRTDCRGRDLHQGGENCEISGVTPYVPKPDRSKARSRGQFPKSAFRYDAETDAYACPAGARLVPVWRTRVSEARCETHVIHYANRAACAGCAVNAPQADIGPSPATRKRPLWSKCRIVLPPDPK